MRARADGPDLSWSDTDRRAVETIRVLTAGDRSADGPRSASVQGPARGGSVLAKADGGTPDVILIATGNEVRIALAAQELPRGTGVAASVVSMPRVEWFAEQDDDYRGHVPPASVHARVSIEAGLASGRREYMGDAGAGWGLAYFGAAGDHRKLYAEFGVTAEHAARAAHASLAAVTAAGGRR
jgi:transketolase